MNKHELKRFLPLFPLIFLISCGQKSAGSADSMHASHSIDYHVEVIKVSDGDTFIGLTSKNERVRFRLQGIDAPERRQAFSNRSAEKLSELIYGKTVGIQVHTQSDRYDRPVVYAYTPEGLDVCAEMLRSGMAWHYKHYDDTELYDRLERNARKRKVGLWQDKRPVPPWEYRKMEKQRSNPIIIPVLSDKIPIIS